MPTVNRGFIIRKKGVPSPSAAKKIARTLIYPKFVELSEKNRHAADQDSDTPTVEPLTACKTKA